jgi:hypothetical protein
MHRAQTCLRTILSLSPVKNVLLLKPLPLKQEKKLNAFKTSEGKNEKTLSRLSFGRENGKLSKRLANLRPLNYCKPFNVFDMRVGEVPAKLFVWKRVLFSNDYFFTGNSASFVF